MPCEVIIIKIKIFLCSESNKSGLKRKEREKAALVKELRKSYKTLIPLVSQSISLLTKPPQIRQPSVDSCP